MKIIKLTKSKTALVCDCHYDLVKNIKWQYHRNGYALSAYYHNGKHKVIRMHRVINNTPKGFDTDHINRNKLDNRCTNLRTVTRSQNNQNSYLRIDNKSGIKGISWDRTNKKWRANANVNGKVVNLGRFTDIQSAINARLKAGAPV